MTAIDQNERVTFVLGAFVLNEHVNSAEFSHAQAFADLTKLNWIDEDFGESVPVSGTDFSSTLVPGTRYES
jgi:hypothetical protein